MKTIIITIISLLFSSMLWAQTSGAKLLPLEQVAVIALQEQLITQAQKGKIDTLIIKLNSDREQLKKDKAAGTVNSEDYAKRNKSISTELTNNLKKVLVTAECYKRWMGIRSGATK